MLGTQFYHETIRKMVVSFGTIFNNINLVRKDNNGTIIQKMKVPLAYGPKQKFLARLDQDADLTSKVAITLPRIGFEIQNMAYDTARKLNRVQKYKKVKSGNTGQLESQYMPVPYNLDFELFVMAKQSDDALQIIEQILPFFQPDYTVTINDMADMGIKRDVPIVLNDVSFTDDYEGEMEGRRVITYDLSFTMKTYFFGPIGTSKLITKVIERSYIGDGNAAFSSSQIDSSGLVKEVKHYEPAFSAVCNAVSNSATVTFDTAINSGISTGDEVVGTGNTTNPTVSAIANNRLSITLSAAATITDETTLFFVGSVDPNDTYVVSEEVTFYDDGTSRDFTADKTTDAS